jgi:hypothetical protein
MDQRDRQAIDELFGKLRQVEAQTRQRDPEAETYISRQVSQLPAAPYYMAQAIVAQEQALANLLSNTKKTGQVNGNRVMTVPELVNAYAAGDPAAVVEVDRVLLECGLNADSLMAQALAKRLDDVERLDRMIAGADARRNKALSELERRRDSFARRLRVTAGEITDVVQA